MKTLRLLLPALVLLVCTMEVSSQTSQITARQLVAEIQKQVGVEWQKDTVDTFKAGNPDTPVTGVAVTMMATMDVLQRASAKGLNFIITHEPTFYAHLDTPEGVPQDDQLHQGKYHRHQHQGGRTEELAHFALDDSQHSIHGCNPGLGGITKPCAFTSSSRNCRPV